MSLSKSLRIVLALTFFVFAVSSVQAQQGSLLEEVRKRKEVAAQAFEQEIESLFAQAERSKSDPLKAAELLKKALTQLEKDEVLTARKRASLAQKAKDRLSYFDSLPKNGPGIGPKAGDSKFARKNIQAEDEAIRRGLI